MAGAALGLVVDRLLGEPPLDPHPLSVLGRGLVRVEEALYGNNRMLGAGYATAGVLAGAGVGAAIDAFGGPVVGTALGAYGAIGGYALGDAALEVAWALSDDDIEEARRRLPSLVGRDPSKLDTAGICKAVVESVAENTTDAVVAPALWAAIGGATGAVAHRAADTMDSMVGYHSDRYRKFGWASARLDDVMAWVPARVTAAMVALANPSRASIVLSAVRRYAVHHPSPNAGVAEAAFAANLGLQLGGTTDYGDHIEHRPVLGSGRSPGVSDIARAVQLSEHVGTLLAAALAGGAVTVAVVDRACRRRDRKGR